MPRDAAANREYYRISTAERRARVRARNIRASAQERAAAAPEEERAGILEEAERLANDAETQANTLLLQRNALQAVSGGTVVGRRGGQGGGAAAPPEQQLQPAPQPPPAQQEGQPPVPPVPPVLQPPPHLVIVIDPPQQPPQQQPPTPPAPAQQQQHDSSDSDYSSDEDMLPTALNQQSASAELRELRLVADYSGGERPPEGEACTTCQHDFEETADMPLLRLHCGKHFMHADCAAKWLAAEIRGAMRAGGARTECGMCRNTLSVVKCPLCSVATSAEAARVHLADMFDMSRAITVRDAAARANAALREQNNGLETQVQQLQAELAGAQQAATVGSVASTTAAQQRVTQLEAEVAALRARVAELEGDNAALHDEVTSANDCLNQTIEQDQQAAQQSSPQASPPSQTPQRRTPPQAARATPTPAPTELDQTLQEESPSPALGGRRLQRGGGKGRRPVLQSESEEVSDSDSDSDEEEEGQGLGKRKADERWPTAKRQKASKTARYSQLERARVRYIEFMLAIVKKYPRGTVMSAPKFSQFAHEWGLTSDQFKALKRNEWNGEKVWVQVRKGKWVFNERWMEVAADYLVAYIKRWNAEVQVCDNLAEFERMETTPWPVEADEGGSAGGNVSVAEEEQEGGNASDAEEEQEGGNASDAEEEQEGGSDSDAEEEQEGGSDSDAVTEEQDEQVSPPARSSSPEY